MALKVVGTLLCLQLVAIISTTKVNAHPSHYDQSEQQWLDSVKDLLRKYEGIILFSLLSKSMYGPAFLEY